MLPILLHMHQPDYRDPVTGDPVLPWVRKHALRGYRDVPWILKKTGARATVNLVPSLLDQLDHYAAGGSDPLLRLLESPLASLTRGDALLLAEQVTDIARIRMVIIQPRLQAAPKEHTISRDTLLAWLVEARSRAASSRAENGLEM